MGRLRFDGLTCSSLYSVRQNLKGEWKSSGDPTEVALQVFATKVGLGQPTLTASSLSADSDRAKPLNEDVVEGDDQNKEGDKEGAEKQKKQIFFSDGQNPNAKKRFELKAEFPFSSSVKRMSTIYFDEERPGVAIVMIKGAVRIPCRYRYWDIIAY